ncbi:hypothetical protein [Clostridium polynesiense]|uniref:hypothetical protein n=1 Tax=Clostridium polynesiense TaxID=1325933 RepID=UPI00058B8ABB|nr:hypothetical protein [Clostridium polynesiense]
MKIKLSKFFYSFILTLAFVFIFAGCGNGNALNKAEAENQNLYNQKEKLYSNQMYGKSSEKTDYEKPDEESLKKAAEKTDAKTKDIQPANSTDKSKAKNDKEQKTPAAEAESKKLQL